MRVWVRATVLSLVGAAALIVPVSPASADCVTDDLGELAGRADVAFVGTVTQVRGDVARLVVSDVYEGSPGSQAVVDGDDPRSSVGVGWRTDRQYLVLAQDSGGTLSTTDCDGTAEVSDEVLAEAESVFGPATPLGRGAGAAAPGATPATSPSAAPSATDPDGADAAPASDERDTGTSRLALGIALGIALAASFFLPQLRRHNREWRRARDDGDAA